MNVIDQGAVADFCQGLEAGLRDRIGRAADRWAEVKRAGGKVVVATGSGPNLHEGVTTLLAGMIDKGLVDGILTSSAVVAHEMAGTLERVKRVDGRTVGVDPAWLPADGMVELSLLSDDSLEDLAGEMDLDRAYIEALQSAPGHEIVKVAGNLAYPTGLRTERLATELGPLAAEAGLPFERVVGAGADRLTMIGAGAGKGAPVLVTTPQLVGGGAVGLMIAESIPATMRSAAVAEMLAGADLIIESGLALAQEIHDGPFEVYTGHGLWAAWEGEPVYSLEDKTVVRIDLDPALGAAVEFQRQEDRVGSAIDQGRPKTKDLGLPFRMEMSGFARMPGSVVIQADLGAVWPGLALEISRRSGVELPFYCLPQETEGGGRVRDWIVERVRPVDRSACLAFIEYARRRMEGNGAD